MSTPTTHERSDAFLHRLQRLVAEDAPWTGTGIRRDWFGEDWILPQACWEALQTGRINDLVEALDGLRSRPFEILYAEREVAEQGRRLAEGAICAVLAACCYSLRRDDPAVVEHLHRAAAEFDAAWPAPPGRMAAGAIADDPCFAAYAAGTTGQGPTASTVGFWTAWDLFDRLLGATHDHTGRRLPITELPGRCAASPPVAEFVRTQTPRIARLPLLLVAPQTSEGRLALLTVTLVPDGGGVFCPDPLAMGLSALWQGSVDDPRNLHESMQRIWRLSGLSDRYRGRWSFTALTAETVQGFAKPSSAAPLISPWFSGRSAEAAVWCALQAAASDAEHPLLLDREATVTAMFDGSAAAGDPRHTPLKRIEGIIPKLHAADDFLRMVVVAREQERVEIDGRIEIARVGTASRALDRLLGVHRHVRNYQQQVGKQWEENWATGGEVGGRESRD